MKAAIFTTAWLIILFLTANPCSAQSGPDTTLLYRIETVNGNAFIGNILSQDSARIDFKSRELGKITIPVTEVVKMSRIDLQQMKNGVYWFENPQSSRYFWAPNGYGLKAGEAYFQNVWVFYNQVSVGLNDYFSIGAGMIPLFLFAGTSTPVWVVPKFSIPVVKDKLNVGGGAIIGTILGEEPVGFGIVYGVSTFGSRDNNLSVGLGYGFAAGEWAKTPLVNVSGMTRVSKNTYLVTENYFVGFGDNVTTLLGIGGRSIIRQSAGIDYGLIIPLNAGQFFAIPWLGITIPFGKVPQTTKSSSRIIR